MEKKLTKTASVSKKTKKDIIDFPKNRMLINAMYLNKKETDGKNDVMLLITKDKDGNKYCDTYVNPLFSYYKTKEEYWDEEEKAVDYISKDKVEEIFTPYKYLYKNISNCCDDARMKNMFQNALNSNSISWNLKQIHLDYRLHSSDKDIEDYYIDKFLEVNPYEENSFEITKSFYDIEVDSTNIIGFPNQEEAKCPINIVSLFDYNNMKIYVLALDYDNEMYKEFMKKSNIKKHIEKLKNKIKEQFPDLIKKFNKEIEIEVTTYKEEIELIGEFFYIVNEVVRPDYLAAWNTGFDLTTFFYRIINLGYEPESIMCPEDFEYKKAYIRLDKKNQDPDSKSDTYFITCFTNHIDLLNLFANITKPQGKKDSYTLDAIAYEISGVHKDELEGNIKTAHLDNYENFFDYNIQDTCALTSIEHFTNHIDLLHLIALMTRTRPSSALKKTICLRNFAEIFYRNEGMVISNNHSCLKPKSFCRGAFVGDPNNIGYFGKELNGVLSNRIFEYVIDFDLSSLYPSIIRAYNISPNTELAKVKFNLTDDYENDRFIDRYMTRDSINFSIDYYNLPSFDELVEALA